jgi:hypothetical protein
MRNSHIKDRELLKEIEQFQDLAILVQGKNLKTLTMAETWEGMVRQFQRHWGNAINESFLSEQFYFDIGKETCPTAELSYLKSRG